MRPTIAAALALTVFLCGGAADGADLIRLAETGAFLLGNANRCGVSIERVKQAGQVIRGMIAAASRDPDEEADADARFSQVLVATAIPDQGGDTLIPPCKVVIAQFELLERHHQKMGMQ
jgi:hypothetical protein